MNQYEAFLKYLKEFDCEMLELILYDCYSYQGVKKSTFLNELNKVLTIWKEKGDTAITLEKGRCRCPGCQDSDLQGWTLIGNKTESYLNLMFRLEKDVIVDIFHCRTWYEKDGICNIYDFENENVIQTYVFHEICFPEYLSKE